MSIVQSGILTECIQYHHDQSIFQRIFAFIFSIFAMHWIHRYALMCNQRIDFHLKKKKKLEISWIESIWISFKLKAIMCCLNLAPNHIGNDRQPIISKDKR